LSIRAETGLRPAGTASRARSARFRPGRRPGGRPPWNPPRSLRSPSSGPDPHTPAQSSLCLAQSVWRLPVGLV